MKCFLFSVLIIAIWTASSAVWADPTVVYDNTTIVPNSSVAPGTAADYAFFGSAQPIHLTNFNVDLSFSDGEYPGFMDATGLQLPGGSPPFGTGLATNRPTDTDPVLVTFSPTSGTTTNPVSFNVWVLDDNSSANDSGVRIYGNVSVAITANGSALPGASASADTDATHVENEFTEFTVTGATSSDVFQVYASTIDEADGSSRFPSIGGLTFEFLGPADALAVPEPSTVVDLSGVGAMGLLFVVRRRINNAR